MLQPSSDIDKMQNLRSKEQICAYSGWTPWIIQQMLGMASAAFITTPLIAVHRKTWNLSYLERDSEISWLPSLPKLKAFYKISITPQFQQIGRMPILRHSEIRRKNEALNSFAEENHSDLKDTQTITTIENLHSFIKSLKTASRTIWICTMHKNKCVAIPSKAKSISCIYCFAKMRNHKLKNIVH